MAPPTTTWEELASLRWTRQQVFDSLNPQRGNTMHELKDVSLDGFGGKCTNAVHEMRASEPKIETTTSTEAIEEYKNTTAEVVVRKVTTPLTVTCTVKLSIATKATIQLASTITIPKVAETGFTLTIGTEATEPVTIHESFMNLNTWGFSVAPGETVSIVKDRIVKTVHEVYRQNFGLSQTSKVGTQGDEYNGSRTWLYDANYWLSKPEGTMILNGFSEITTEIFNIIRTTDNKTTKTIIRAPEGVLTGPGHSAPTKIFYAVPGSQ